MSAQEIRDEVIDQLNNNDFYLDSMADDEYVKDHTDGTQTVVTVEMGKTEVIVSNYNNNQSLVASNTYKLPVEMNMLLAKLS